MFKVKSSVLAIFLLVLEIMLKFTPDTCYKSPGIILILTEEGFKLFLGYRDILAFVELMTKFVLGLSKNNTSALKNGSKQDVVSPNGLNNIEIVFALLIKVVTVYL